MDAEKQLRLSLAILLFILPLGVAGYRLIEGWGLIDSLYMTVITLSTIGFREVHDLSPAGRIFTMFLIVFGVGAAAYAFKNATHHMLEGELRNVLGRRKLKKTIRSLKDHFIICGYGRIGRIVVREILAEGVPCVVIENNPQVLAEIRDPAPLMIQADATVEATLEDAGIRTARGLIAALSSDADNLLLVLSARSLNEKIKIVARAGRDGIESKLIRAGADKVVSPYQMGGIKIAHAMLRPEVTDFLELTVQDKTVDLELEQLRVGEESPLVGKTLTESHIRRDFGAILVAIKRTDGRMVFNPTHDTRIAAGDILIVLGEGRRMTDLQAMAGRSGSFS